MQPAFGRWYGIDDLSPDEHVGIPTVLTLRSSHHRANRVRRGLDDCTGGFPREARMGCHLICGHAEMSTSFARISIHVLEYPLTLSRPCRRSQCSLSIILVGKSGRRLRAACNHVGGAGVPRADHPRTGVSDVCCRLLRRFLGHRVTPRAAVGGCWFSSRRIGRVSCS
jgi:hypothetical protein